ncbi:hypothetical protein Lal_00019765 [Lupinus albus]|nr:hypothetical protein Lal_00019765 [Lupinus albus]
MLLVCVPHLCDIFYRMGLSNKDIVAMPGGHLLGISHPERSGFDGPWTEDPLKFDNSYFVELSKEDSAGLLKLPTGKALLDAPEFCNPISLYAMSLCPQRQLLLSPKDSTVLVHGAVGVVVTAVVVLPVLSSQKREVDSALLISLKYDICVTYNEKYWDQFRSFNICFLCTNRSNATKIDFAGLGSDKVLDMAITNRNFPCDSAFGLAKEAIIG